MDNEQQQAPLQEKASLSQFMTDELANKINSRNEYQRLNGIEPINCENTKCPRAIQTLNEYNDLRIPCDMKPGAPVYPVVTKYVEILFKCKRKKIYRNDLNLSLSPAQFVIVEIDNGLDIGTIYCLGEEAAKKIHSVYKGVEPENSIVRIATETDLARNKQNIDDAAVVITKARELTEHFSLEMKITEAEWQFDHQRLTIYFTAPQRIDFRDLVKELARTFRTRIELRQISTREEAKRLGGIGPCGRYICCSTCANDFCHVTLDHARLQQLSNNVAKLSGYCGRLKCCLLYEYDYYVEAYKKFPPIETEVTLPEGIAKIIKIDIFKEVVHLIIPGKPAHIIKSLEEIEQLEKDGKLKRPAFIPRHEHEELDAETLKELRELEKEY